MFSRLMLPDWSIQISCAPAVCKECQTHYLTLLLSLTNNYILTLFNYRFPSWSFADWAQFELDTLEDIFKRSDWQERALKPALSSILAPALCAVYGKHSNV